MVPLLIGYARVSTDEQDLTAQRDALAACRAGDTLVVAKLDRLARSLPDARAILEDLNEARGEAQSRRIGARPNRSRSAGCCSTC